jgi:hypothetical protein
MLSCWITVVGAGGITALGTPPSEEEDEAAEWVGEWAMAEGVGEVTTEAEEEAKRIHEVRS